ncbi:VIT1/CCC1 transporter family protein [Candidatus Uhrbacteria bacterium]|nr:VIT1/CCC1 transporter family protein [Candidatus Uhrbacteria bacterium]
MTSKLPLEKDAEFFAYHQYRDYVVFRELAKRETVPAFKAILEQLIESEYQDYSYWLRYCVPKKFYVPQRDILFFVFLRRVFGLTFTAKFLERDEKEIIEAYQQFLQHTEEPLRSDVAKILEHEREHERMLISQIREGKVEFLGSIILGLNDGLIELSGALIGFAFALQQSRLVGILGFITGISAAFSMSASAYLQARYDQTRNPRIAAAYTGITYLVVVAILVAPFLFITEMAWTLLSFFAVVAVLILVTSFYASVVQERRFRTVAGEMVLLSVGVTFLTFLLASLFRELFGMG